MVDLNELKTLLSKKNITLKDEIKFKSKNEEISFLNKLEKLIEKKIGFKILNSDLIEIIKDVELNDENILTLKEINWEDYSETFLEKQSNSRKEKIYNNFLNFLKAELELSHFEKPLIDKKLVETKTSQKNEININEEILKKNEDFNLEEDFKEKIKKYNVDVLFDYNEPSSKITVNDFTLYFNKRLEYFTNLLKGRVNVDNVQRISNLVDLYDTNEVVSIIGLISDIAQTKNGHYMITIEDRSSQIKCFVNKDKTEMIKKI